MKRTVWPFERQPRWLWWWRIAGYLVFLAALTFTNLLWDGPLATELAVIAAGSAVHIAVLVVTERRWKRESGSRSGDRDSANRLADQPCRVSITEKRLPSVSASTTKSGSSG